MINWRNLRREITVAILTVIILKLFEYSQKRGYFSIIKKHVRDVFVDEKNCNRDENGYSSRERDSKKNTDETEEDQEIEIFDEN